MAWRLAATLAWTGLLFAASQSISSAQISLPSHPPLLTNVSQIATFASALGVRAAIALQLDGTVLLGGERETIVALDGSDSLFPMTGNGRASLRRGDRIHLTGHGILDGANLILQPRPLIENDGEHSLEEKSAGVWLDAGNQPIRLRYFSRSGDQGLIISIQGPDLPRQPLPGQLLFHALTNPVSGTVEWKPGINFKTHLGSWKVTPDFSVLPIAARGVVTNIELTVTPRTHDFGLDFSGALRLPRTGFYVFSVQSDDGALLDIGSLVPSIEVVGKTNLPSLRRLSAGQLLGGEPAKFCAAMEGEVTFASLDGDALRLELVSGRSRALARVAGVAGLDPQGLIGARLRLEGICQRVFTPEGYEVAGRISVPDRENIQWLSAPEALWNSEISTVSEAAALNRSNAAPALVHLRGTIQRDAASDEWLFEDASGRLRLERPDAALLKPEGLVDVIAFRGLNGNNAFLAGTLARAVVSSIQNELPTLTSVEQVKHMSREEAKRGYPVKVRGIITFVWPDAGFFLQDATGSIDVRMAPSAAAETPQIGDFWEVTGETFAEFAPNIRASQASRIGPGTLPNVVHPNWGQLVDGSLDAQFVELQGVLLSAQSNSVSLLTRGGRIKVELPDISQEVLSRLEGALIRVSGCLIPGRDIHTQQVKLGEFSLRSASIAVDQPAPKDPFALPLRQATDLLLFDSHTSPIQRTHLQGVLIQQRDGLCYLMDGTSGVRAILKSPVQLEPGDQLELVGFPDLNGPSPVLHDAVVRVIGKRSLPAAMELSSDHLLSGVLDSTRVKISATLTATRLGDLDWILEMRSGPRLWLARLPLKAGALPELTPGSELRLTGVYAGQGGDRANGRDIDSFELLLSSPKNVEVLAEPSWWTVRHALTVAGGLLAGLALAMVWIGALRRKVENRTAALQQEVEDHKRTELQLEEKTKMLTREIDERVRMEAEVERGHKQLLITSRLAGMAEVATSVLHNVGNVMTSVNVLGSSIVDHVKNSKVSSLTRLGDLLVEKKGELNRFLADDERGQKLPDYVQRLGHHLIAEQTVLLEKVKVLNQNIHHINEIVAMQQNYAKVSGVFEKVPPEELIEDALRMHGESLKRHGIELIRNFEKLPPITTDRHKVLQILFNLLENAKHACLHGSPAGKHVTVTMQQPAAGWVRIAVADNGIGIPPENLPRLFGQGFSTRKDGHGFGLHSSVLTAQDMGGTLKAHSDGVSQGATFTLEIPTEPHASSRHETRDGTGSSREPFSSEPVRAT